MLISKAIAINSAAWSHFGRLVYGTYLLHFLYAVPSLVLARGSIQVSHKKHRPSNVGQWGRLISIVCVKKSGFHSKVSILGHVKFQGVHNTLERLFLTIQHLDPLKFSHWFSRLSLLRLARLKRMASRSHDDKMLSLVVFGGFCGI